MLAILAPCTSETLEFVCVALSGGAIRRLTMPPPAHMKLYPLSSALCSQRNFRIMFRYELLLALVALSEVPVIHVHLHEIIVFWQDTASSVSRVSGEFSPAEAAHSMSAGGRADALDKSRSKRPVCVDTRQLALHVCVCIRVMRALQALMSPSLGSLLAPSRN